MRGARNAAILAVAELTWGTDWSTQDRHCLYQRLDRRRALVYQSLLFLLGRGRIHRPQSVLRFHQPDPFPPTHVRLLLAVLPGFIFLCGALELANRCLVSGQCRFTIPLLERQTLGSNADHSLFTTGAVRLTYGSLYSLFLGFGLSIGAEIYTRAGRESAPGGDDYTVSSARHLSLLTSDSFRGLNLMKAVCGTIVRLFTRRGALVSGEDPALVL